MFNLVKLIDSELIDLIKDVSNSILSERKKRWVRDLSIMTKKTKGTIEKYINKKLRKNWVTLGIVRKSSD